MPGMVRQGQVFQVNSMAADNADYDQAKRVAHRAIAACVPTIASAFIRVVYDNKLTRQGGATWIGVEIRAGMGSLRARVRVDVDLPNTIEILPIR